MLPLGSLADSLGSFFDAVGDFFASFADLRPIPLVLGLGLFVLYLSFRARASFHILRAAYPAERIAFRQVWGAYVAGYGFNNVVPARGGDVVRLYLTKTSVPRSSYSAVAAAFAVESGFDLAWGVVILTFAFTQGVFPKLPDFSDIPAFDITLVLGNPQLTLFVLTLLGVGVLVGFAVFSRRVRDFWLRVRQGLTIAFDRRRYLREVFAVQAAGLLVRMAAFWCLLEAFGIGGSVRNVLLVLGVNAVAAAFPFTPGGAGVQQAFLVKVFGAGAAAYSVGQQIAIAATTLLVGFGCLVWIFGFRSFKEVIAAGRSERAREKAARTPAA